MTSVISPLSLLSKMSKSANPSIIWIDSALPKCLFRKEIQAPIPSVTLHSPPTLVKYHFVLTPTNY